MIFNAFFGIYTLSSSFVSHDNFLTLEHEKRDLMVGDQVVREGHVEDVLGETSTLITPFKLKKAL